MSFQDMGSIAGGSIPQPFPLWLDLLIGVVLGVVGLVCWRHAFKKRRNDGQR